MLLPNQFQVNEAWVAFDLNEEPIHTDRDGSFNCICLMDAASLYILSNALVPADQLDPSVLVARRLLQDGWKSKKQYPVTLLLPTGRYQPNLAAQAKRKKISVVSVDEQHLLVFVNEAREGFNEMLRRKADSEA